MLQENTDHGAHEIRRGIQAARFLLKLPTIERSLQSSAVNLEPQQ